MSVHAEPAESATRAPGVLRTVWLLLRVARRRAVGRGLRQKQLLNNRSGKRGAVWSRLGSILAVGLTILLNAMAAYLLTRVVSAAPGLGRAGANHALVVHQWFLEEVQRQERLEHNASAEPDSGAPSDTANYRYEAKHLAYEYGSNEKTVEAMLRKAVHDHGSAGLVVRSSILSGLEDLPNAAPEAAMLGSLVLMFWFLMLAFQGEGLEIDLQRRRHPMWEWLFSHPVQAPGIFLAEILSPLAANPIYATAPLFSAILYSLVYGPWTGIAAGVAVGIPIAIAAACLGKALEIGIILRFSARSRGAMIGIMSWLGYSSMMLFLLGGASSPALLHQIGVVLHPLTTLPWPWLGYFLGQTRDGFSVLAGLLGCWLFAAVVTLAAVWFSVWGAQQGLSGNLGRADSAPTPSKTPGLGFGKEPLYRKELLWFSRDRSAIVQTLLVPLTVAGFQLFNLRSALSAAGGAWNFICGASILFGTYFLWVLGPRSLASEGSALWLALTWPRGMESLLKAKAWLWSMISSAIVCLILGFAWLRYPDSWWKIVLVGIGWWFFSRSMAEKTVTLVSVTSQSGEPEKIPAMRRWAASLGMLTFAIGIFTQQWNISIMGIVYSHLTAAAMWQNFRARLPFLFDPWSEILPPPPTLMHAMIAISIMVEGGAVVATIALAAVGRESLATIQVTVYAVCAVLVALGVHQFLRRRGVPARAIWCWPDVPVSPPGHGAWYRGDGSTLRLARLLGLGALGGVALGGFAHGYTLLLQHIPMLEAVWRQGQEQLLKIPGLRTSYTIMAIGFAPFAEEYLFRGLLFRALDREWGGWKAVFGSAAFFAIFHPPLSWLPVGLLGVANALLFKRTGRLAPAVVLHLVYNAVVLLAWR